jgi:UDP-N-acetyl-D-glucosamine dehydrogenase
MVRYVVERATLALNRLGKAVRGSRILAIGVAYKPGTNDLRESPALKILRALLERGGEIQFHDPLVPGIRLDETELHSQPLVGSTLDEQDLILILMRQTGVDWDLIAGSSCLVFDACNALGSPGANTERL